MTATSGSAAVIYIVEIVRCNIRIRQLRRAVRDAGRPEGKP